MTILIIICYYNNEDIIEMELLLKKIEQGVFYTIKNCFNNHFFIKWFKNIPHIKERIFIDPGAGENNIIQMIVLIIILLI